MVVKKKQNEKIDGNKKSISKESHIAGTQRKRQPHRRQGKKGQGGLSYEMPKKKCPGKRDQRQPTPESSFRVNSLIPGK